MIFFFKYVGGIREGECLFERDRGEEEERGKLLGFEVDFTLPLGRSNVILLEIEKTPTGINERWKRINCTGSQLSRRFLFLFSIFYYHLQMRPIFIEIIVVFLGNHLALLRCIIQSIINEYNIQIK